MSTENLDPIVKINVGGFKCELSRSIFQAYPDSTLAKMFSEEHGQFLPPAKLDESGHYIINRDPRIFPFILQLYLNGTISAMSSETSEGLFEVFPVPFDAISRELEFFQLPTEFLNSSVSEDDKVLRIIMKNKYQSDLLESEQQCRKIILKVANCICKALPFVSKVHGPIFMAHATLNFSLIMGKDFVIESAYADVGSIVLGRISVTSCFDLDKATNEKIVGMLEPNSEPFEARTREELGCILRNISIASVKAKVVIKWKYQYVHQNQEKVGYILNFKIQRK